MFSDFDRRYVDLSRLPFSDEVQTGIDAAVQLLPAVDSLHSASEKSATLLRRGRAKLLLPLISSEVETDLNKALKLSPEDPDVWLAMAEALWKRNAVQEARDALSSALRIDPNHQRATVMMSRMLRTSCNGRDVTAEQRTAALDEAIALGKKAVSISSTDGDSWFALGLAILQQTVLQGMSAGNLKRTLATLNQAVSFSSWNPDVWYNRGVVNRSLGRYGQAVSDFSRAYELDPRGLSGAKGLAATSLRMLKGFVQMSAECASRENKKMLSRIPAKKGETPMSTVQEAAVASSASPGRTVFCSAAIVSLLSPAADQPLSFFAIDKNATPFCILIPCCLPTALKRGDVVVFAVPPAIVEITEQVVPVEVESDAGASSAAPAAPSKVSIAVVHTEAGQILVNGRPLAASEICSAQLTTRQFQ